MNRHRKLVFLLPWLLSVAALGQDAPSISNEEGLPFFMSFYGPQDYQAQPQNWSFAQDKRGVIYVANNNGVLEYDGVSWRLIQTATDVGSLDTDERGVVYAGLQGDFGYLAPDSSGTLQYVSLLDEVPPSARDFTDVWNVRATSEGVYFQTRSRLFRWDGHEIKTWDAERLFHNAYAVHGELYIREVNKGLLRMEGDSLRVVPDGERFGDLAIYAIVPYDDTRLLIGTRREGFFIYDGTSAVPFPTEADALLNNNLYTAAQLPGGFFVLATGGIGATGAFLIDQRGRLVRILDESSGVNDRHISDVFADAQGGLWMALSNLGVLRIDVPSEITAFDRSFGLQGAIYSVLRHQDTLYVATGAGLYFLEYQPLAEIGRPHAVFTRVEGLDHHTTSLLSYDGELLAATYQGIYRVREGQGERLDDRRFFSLLISDYADGLIYAGTKQGLALMQRTPSGWSIRSGVVDAGSEIVAMAEGNDGTLWLSTRGNELLRVRFPDGLEAAPAVEHLDQKDGLPEGHIMVYAVDGDVVFASTEGIFRFRESAASERAFYPDTTLLSPGATEQDELLSITEDDTGRIWSVYADRVEISVQQADGTYERYTPPFLRFPKTDVPQIYIEGRGVAWLSNGETLVRYDPNAPVEKPYGAPFQALVRRVTTATTGALLHGGAYTTKEGHLAETQAGATVPELEYQSNALAFEVAAPSFNAPEQTEYQYYLEGEDEDWTDWMDATRRIYTNLREGDYRFRVRARNGQGFISREGIFSFGIIPPWYRTPWAYLGYLIVLLAGVALTWQYRRIVQENRRARAQADELARERVVNERLQELNDELHQANKLKDEFLATTSHELRTPLTAILGFTSILREELPEHYHEFLFLIDDSGKRLLHTLSSLLDLAKLRSGMMALQPETIDVAHRVRKVVHLLTPLAREKQLTLKLSPPKHPVVASLDGYGLERILYNLVGNAIKFTEEGGVEVKVEQQDGWVHIHVRDTGIGIDADFRPSLFTEFQQESSGLARSHQGSGLGLAVTARLVELLDGKIDVQSEKGEGSTFTVSFHAAERPAEERPAARPPGTKRNRPPTAQPGT
ncbi:MAG: ATP-binding protein [Rhodothermales bacterium]